jgi:drug/metabolite transporter (DMT)-like permease
VTSGRRLIVTAEGAHAGAFTGRDWMLFIGPGLLWGPSFFFIAVGLQAFDPLVITPLRLLFGFLTLSLMPAVRARIDRADLGRVLFLGASWMAIPLSMFPFAEQRVSSALTGMLNGATPLFATAFAIILLRRPPGRFQRWGVGIGFLGIALIALPSLGEGRTAVVGVALIVVALVCYGVSLNMAVPLQQRYGSLPVLWRAQMVAVALTAPLGLLGLSGSSFSWRSLLAVAALGILGTGVAYVAMGTLAGRVGATRASVATYLIPVVAIALGVVFLDEEVHWLSLVGTLVVVGGAWLSSRKER